MSPSIAVEPSSVAQFRRQVLAASRVEQEWWAHILRGWCKDTAARPVLLGRPTARVHIAELLGVLEQHLARFIVDQDGPSQPNHELAHG